AREMAARFGLVSFRKIGLEHVFGFGRVAVDGEGELPAAGGAGGVVVELPRVARPVVADGCRAEMAWYERRDERAATLVPGGDEAHGQARAAVFAVHVHS